MHVRRALLYMPGDDLRKIRKAATLDLDCVCMDMEDGVAINRKAAAREIIFEALSTLNFGRSERLVRINAVGSGLESDDLKAVLPAHPDGIVVPKVEYPEQIRFVSDQISLAEATYSWPSGGISLIVVVETARGILNLAQIAGVDPRLQALIFGAEDFAGDIGATRTPQAWEIFYARSAIVTHAAAFSLQAIDMVCVDLHNLEELKRQALQGAEMGFAGKQVIHPDQVIPVQEAFTPSQQAIEYAIKIMEAFHSHQQAGIGAFALDGKMVDMPVIRGAERILALANAAGKL